MCDLQRQKIHVIIVADKIYVRCDQQSQETSICAKGDFHLLVIYYKRKNLTKSGSALA